MVQMVANHANRMPGPQSTFNNCVWPSNPHPTFSYSAVVLTSLIRDLDAPVLGLVISTSVAPAWSPLLGCFIPHHPTSLPLVDPLHASVLLPSRRLLRCRNLTSHHLFVTLASTQSSSSSYSRSWRGPLCHSCAMATKNGWTP